MKKLILKTSFALLTIVMLGLTACNKDESCGLRLSVVDGQGNRIPNVWVRTDVPENANCGDCTSDYRTQRNIGTANYLEYNFKLPARVQVWVYAPETVDFDPANALFSIPKVVQLTPGETKTQEIVIP